MMMTMTCLKWREDQWVTEDDLDGHAVTWTGG